MDFRFYRVEVLESGTKVGIDGFCMSVSDVRNLKNALSPKNITIQKQIDLLGEMWFDRPALPVEKIIRLDTKYVGESAGERIGKIREFIRYNHGDAMLFSCLDEIAWLYNIRCNDIAYNPVAISYAIVEKDKAHLFIKLDKISQEIDQQLAEDGIELHDYHHLFLFLDEQNKENTYFVDTNTCNYAVFNHLAKKFEVREIESPIPLLKAVKNTTELDGFRLACRKDGVALSKFYYWLENRLSQQPITELEAAEQLTWFRSQDKEYVSDSFGCISAYGPNAALPHDLSMLYFPKGSKGCNIDIVARLPLYMNLRNFGHGTGHGVGYFLNVHEGPQSIRPDLKNQEMLPGMVTSNEPGLYREGLHGIRHENLIVCQPKTVNEFGEFYQFETITLCYFDTSALLTKLLNQKEIDWLNAYNERVYQEVSPYLEEQERIWLRNKTKAI